MEGISKFLVKTDRFCDYVPFVSSATNLIDLFQKCVFLPFINQETIQSNHYYKHISEKSFARCFLLIIPVIGNIIIGICDLKKTTPKIVAKEVSLEEVSKITEPEKIKQLSENLKVNDRKDYIQCMLIFAIYGQNFFSGDGGVDLAFHYACAYTHHRNELKSFVREDIQAGRRNEDDNTLLHEILKCEFLTPKAKGEAFNFIFRDGHEFLREYLGNKILLEPNQWGDQVEDFPPIPWGDSLNKVFNKFSIEERVAFFSPFEGLTVPDRLEALAGIKMFPKGPILRAL